MLGFLSLSADVGRFRVSGGRDGLSGTRAGVTFAEINARIKPAADVSGSFMFFTVFCYRQVILQLPERKKKKKEKVLTNSS